MQCVIPQPPALSPLDDTLAGWRGGRVEEEGGVREVGAVQTLEPLSSEPLRGCVGGPG